MKNLLIVAALIALTPGAVWAQQTLDVIPGQFELNGLHEGRQLLVMGANQRDLTRDAVYTVEPANIVRVSTQGYVRPIAKGTAVIRIENGGQKREVKVIVTDS